MLSEKEKESMWLFCVLDFIGVNNEYRMKSQKACIMNEIIQSYDQKRSIYIFGSRSEGIFSSDGRNDMDIIICDETIPVIEDITESGQNPLSLLIVTEPKTFSGYVKLQLVINGVPCTHMHWPNVFDVNIPLECLKTDSLGRIVLFDIPPFNDTYIGPRCMNKPSAKHGPIDIVQCFRCKTWPSIAQEWLIRQRLFGWPLSNTIQEITSLGYFLVKKGHPFSSDKDLEWRISLSLQERKLMFGLTDVQYKCYYALKMFNRNFIKLDYITSYYWKTCVLHVIEDNNKNIWQNTRLVKCVELCIEQMLKWVKSGFCPNYFIHRDNLFDGKLTNRRRLTLEHILKQRLDIGCLLNFTSNSLFRNNLKLSGNYNWFNWLKAQRMLYENILFDIRISIIMLCGFTVNIFILDHDYHQSNNSIATFIKYLWERLHRIQRINTITEHTTEETKSSLSLLIPFISMNLASNISSMAIQHSNQQVRDFLLFGSLSCLSKGNLAERLKFITVLYAIELYEDCQWFLEREDEQYIKNSPSVCICSPIHCNIGGIDSTHINTSEVFTCVSFLPSELHVIPDAMKYEMFRCIGIGSHENKSSNLVYNWNYIAVVDCNIYFFLLKYLINRKLRRFQETANARLSIAKILFGTNVRHPDVACNVFTWTLCSDFLIPNALRFLKLSWTMMSSHNPYLQPEKEEMLQYQYNAAKLHALVLLYNTWFVRKTSNVYYCFQCFSYSQVKLLKCPHIVLNNVKVKTGRFIKQCVKL